MARPLPNPRNYPGEQARLFIGVAAPPAVIDALAAVRRELEAAGVPRLRWVRPGALHLTLKFLGDTPIQRQAEIVGVMERAIGGTAPQALRLDRLQLFGNRRPRVLWADLGGDVAGVIALAARLDAELARLGFAAESRPFTPHLTLARVPDSLADADRRSLHELLRLVAPPLPVPLPVEAITLVRSRLGAEGPRYEPLAIIPCRE